MATESSTSVDLAKTISGEFSREVQNEDEEAKLTRLTQCLRFASAIQLDVLRHRQLGIGREIDFSQAEAKRLFMELKEQLTRMLSTYGPSPQKREKDMVHSVLEYIIQVCRLTRLNTENYVFVMGICCDFLIKPDTFSDVRLTSSILHLTRICLHSLPPLRSVALAIFNRLDLDHILKQTESDFSTSYHFFELLVSILHRLCEPKRQNEEEEAMAEMITRKIAYHHSFIFKPSSKRLSVMLKFMLDEIKDAKWSLRLGAIIQILGLVITRTTSERKVKQIVDAVVRCELVEAVYKMIAVADEDEKRTRITYLIPSLGCMARSIFDNDAVLALSSSHALMIQKIIHVSSVFFQAVDTETRHVLAFNIVSLSRHCMPYLLTRAYESFHVDPNSPRPVEIHESVIFKYFGDLIRENHWINSDADTGKRNPLFKLKLLFLWFEETRPNLLRHEEINNLQNLLVEKTRLHEIAIKCLQNVIETCILRSPTPLRDNQTDVRSRYNVMKTLIRLVYYLVRNNGQNRLEVSTCLDITLQYNLILFATKIEHLEPSVMLDLKLILTEDRVTKIVSLIKNRKSG